MARKRKVIITVAPTGGFAQKSDNPNLPITPDEIAECVEECCRLGASIAAVHVRRDDGAITNDPELYKIVNAKIRERCNIIINNSTGGGMGPEMHIVYPDGNWEMDFEKRLWGTQGGAEMCTLDCQTQTFDIYPDRPPGLMNTSWRRTLQLAQAMKDNGIKPEYEVMDLSHMLVDAQKVIQAGLDKPPYWFDFVLGCDRRFQGALPYTYDILNTLIDYLPENSLYTVAALGPAQLPANIQAILRGGHVRTGLEDNLYFEKGVLASNEMLVERIANMIELMGHQVATPGEAREMLGLKE